MRPKLFLMTVGLFCGLDSDVARAEKAWGIELGAEVMATAVLRAVRAATRLSGPGVPDLPCTGDVAGIS